MCQVVIDEALHQLSENVSEWDVCRMFGEVILSDYYMNFHRVESKILKTFKGAEEKDPVKYEL